MRQLTFVKAGMLEWRDVKIPKLAGPRQALVRPIAVARCDLDLYIATGFYRLRGPFAFGHEMVGEVIDAGEKAGVVPGQRVVVPFQISCGDCPSCRRGLTASCEAVPYLASYGMGLGGNDFGGALSEMMLVPFADTMLVPLPDNVDPVAAASMADNIPDGWRAVAPQLAQRPGGTVLVLGGLAHSVALYAAGAAVALKAGRVLYLDDDAEKRAIAVAMGAEAEALALHNGREPDTLFDIIVDGSGDPNALAFGIRSAGRDATVTNVAVQLMPLTPLPLTEAYTRGLTLQTSRASARTWLPDALKCMACGHFHPEHVTHKVVPISAAAEAMMEPGPKLVFAAD